MIFNLNDYKLDDYCMHCKTLAEAEEFCRMLDNNGRSWVTGIKYSEEKNWDTYKNKTVYYFNQGVYGSIIEAQKDEDIILEWSDFIKDTKEQCVICNSEIDKNDNEKIIIQVRTDDKEDTSQFYEISKNTYEFLIDLNNDFYLFNDSIIIEKVDLNNIKKY